MSNIICTSVVAEIEQHHALAQQHATAAKGSAATAVEHARRAGRLLLQVKAELPRGEFLGWLAANAKFCARTAQRYMNAAAPTPKCDRLSHSAKPPKAGSRRAQQIAALDRARHRDEVVAHATYLVAELPAARELRSTDLAALLRLRERLDELLNANVLEMAA